MVETIEFPEFAASQRLTRGIGGRMAEATSQELFLVTGKGGVGKSLAAAALAYQQKQAGKSVLLVELGNESFYQDFFGLETEVGFKPQQLQPGLDLAKWSSAECLREYALHLLKSESLYHLFFENIVMKTFIKVAPGLTELAILGKFTSGIRKVGPSLNYDVIVMDSYASGHTTALLRAPKGMAEAVRFGPMGDQSRSILKVMSDPKHLNYYVVTLPEELPFQEAQELVATIEEEVQIKPKLILNRALENIMSSRDAEKFAEEQRETGVGAFAKFYQKSLESQTQIASELSQGDHQVYKVPLITETQSWKLVEEFAERLK